MPETTEERAGCVLATLLIVLAFAAIWFGLI
jgi:hypothetical protein